MVIVTSGKTPDGKPCEFYMDGYLKENMDRVISWVKQKNYDYVSIISGLPGVGKSNFAQTLARYCDEDFSEKNIAFSAEDFITKTNECKEYSAIILDESFQSMNTRVSNSSAFLRIINHLQLIRQKHLFVFLCLPNFFDLNKGISIYRSSHLFLVYSDSEGNRGKFGVFDRESKKQLYIAGMKFMNYSIVPANFIGRFTKQKCIDEKKYERMKRKHLMEMDLTIARKTSKDNSIARTHRDNMLRYLSEKEKWTQLKICEISGMSKKGLYNSLKEIKSKENPSKTF